MILFPGKIEGMGLSNRLCHPAQQKGSALLPVRLPWLILTFLAWTFKISNLALTSGRGMSIR